LKRPQSKARRDNREGKIVSSLSPLDLLAQYFDAAKTKDADELQKLAREIISEESPDI